MKTRMIFDQLKIESIEAGSGLYSGENRIAARRHRKKINEGFGSSVGMENKVTDSSFVINDQDIVDTFNRDSREEER